MWIRITLSLIICSLSAYAKWYTNGNIVSQIDFTTLKKNFRIEITNIIVASNEVISPLVSSNERRALKTITVSTNPAIVSIFSNIVYAEEFQTNLSLKKWIEELLKPPPSPESGLSSQPLLKREKKGPLVLENADILESMVIKKKHVSENIVEISGKVRIRYNSTIIEAEKLVINADTEIVFAEGNLKLYDNNVYVEGEKAILNIRTERGFIYRPEGKLDQLNYKGQLAKINTPGHITLKNIYGTYDTNEKPIFRLRAGTLNRYGGDINIMENLTLGVHNHPFLYFPFYMQDHYGTGVTLRYGITKNEGIFLENKITPFFPGINRLEIDLNFYQKVGAYLRLANENSYPNHNYKFSLALARYLRGEYPIDDEVFYTTFLGEDFHREIEYRYKLDYQHRFNLTPENLKDKGINTSFLFNLKKTGVDKIERNNDPFFTFDLENRSPKQWLPQDLFRGPDDREPRRSFSSPSDRDDINFSFSQRVPPNIDLKLDGDLDFNIWEDNDFGRGERERYTQYLERFTFPKLSLSHGGTLDPQKTNANRKIFLNLNYRFGTEYTLISHYTNTTNKSGTTEILEQYENNLRTTFSFNRSFGFSFRSKSIELLNFSFGLNYTKNWGGEDVPENRRRLGRREYGDLLKIDVSLGRSFALDTTIRKSKLKLFNARYNPRFTFTYQTNWGGERLGENYILENRRQTFERYTFSESLNIYIPSQHQREIWDRRYGYFPLIPKVDFSLNHSYGRLDRSDTNDRTTYQWETHDVSVNLGLNQNGYSLFYIPYLDFNHRVDFVLRYDLSPLRNDEGRYVNRRIDPIRVDREQERIKNYDLNYRLNVFVQPPSFNYKIFEMAYLLDYELFDNRTKIVQSRVNRHNLTFTARYAQKKKNPWFFMEEFVTSFTWSIHEKEEEYTRDFMRFTIGTSFDFLKFFKLSLTMSSVNREAFLYREEAGEDRVNFFEDIWSSLGFNGGSGAARLANQRQALFKFERFGLTLRHDLETWFLELSYNIVPTVITHTDSFKGFYFDQQFFMKINLKPEYEFAQYLEDIKPWERDFRPKALEELRER